jgi:hypothetical protein
MDRIAINRALAKALAFKACGKDAAADAWAAELIRLLDAAHILRDGPAIGVDRDRYVTNG